ncbi:MAG: Holliday junction branch migration protein RuvA [Candidatus Pacebacteria bacterium]|nr:Holliday junction branch migration protein RuvA [Candidatus Paceibacterota bacterium]
MIAYLKGRPLIQKDKLILITGENSDLSAVGYGVFVGSKLLSQLNSDELLELYIYTHVRDDALELYGFPSTDQQYLFELLLDVSGVGPKTALAIVDQSPQQIIEAVQQSQVSFFQQVPRVGKKTAQKIILELKSKLGSIKELSLGPRSEKERDVYEALVSLGYGESDAGQILTQLDLEKLSTEEAVKLALKKVSG